MTHHKARSALPPRRLLFAASGLALTAATAASAVAETPAPVPFAMPSRTEAAAPAQAGDTRIKHLPAGRDELRFRGEMASRRFPVVLGRGEAARISTFQVALRNTVSLLPERSAVTVAINGRTLATLPATAADKLAVVPVAVPPGLLVPGTNTVQVTSTLTHRVDCSVPATYELWATLDPTETGFLVPRAGFDVIATPGDLAAAPLAEDGTTRIRLRMAETADEAEVSQAARAVQVLVRRAKLVRPVVDVGAGPGSGPGLDLVVEGHVPDDVAPVSKTGGVGIGRDPATGRPVVAVDPDAEEPHRPPAAATARAAPDAAEPPRDGFRKTFAQLGRSTEVFTGRRYEATIPVVLPPDFMSTNDRARVRLDGGHSGTLVAGDGLALRVNGTLVSSVPLLAGKAERFEHREVELPLRFFHPGRNDVTIEATLSAEADAQCRTATMPREARLTIADTSELEFPGFAHLTTIPQIPAAMAVRGTMPVYLPGGDPATLGAGLTVLANMAAEGPTATPQVHLGTTDAGAPGLLVAAVDQVPPTLSDALRGITRPVAPPAPADPQAVPPSGDAGATAEAQTPDPAPAPAAPEVGSSRLPATLEVVQSVLRTHGFFFGGDAADRLALNADDLLVAAVAPGGKAPRTALDVMPRFTGDAAHWLVVTAASPGTLNAGLHALVASGRWDELRGEATRFDPAAGTLDVRQPRGVTYVMTADVSPADVRPILGGLMSDNIVMSLVVLFVVLGGLGLSTHAVVRRMGVK